MVEAGFLAPYAVPLTLETNKGINPTWRGRAHLLSGVSQPVYVKFLVDKQLVNELLAAELARLTGFQVPDSYPLCDAKEHPAFQKESRVL